MHDRLIAANDLLSDWKFEEINHDHAILRGHYKCLQNFEYKPRQFELIVGANGTGKSTVFEALDKVRRFVTGQGDARELFPTSCRTKWQLRGEQVFEVDYQIGERTFRYRLEINLSSYDYRVESEELSVDGKSTVKSVWRKKAELTIDIVLGNDDDFDDSDPFSEEEHADEARGITISTEDDVFAAMPDPNKSLFPYTPRSSQLQGLSFTNYIKLNPQVMGSQVTKAQPRPANDLSNFASYYLYILQQKQGRMFDMIPQLREAVNGFDSFAVEEDFEEGRRELRVLFQRLNKERASNGSAPLSFDFEDLSDGQRALIALYMLLFCTLDTNTTLIIDEPENYVALRELQPWLMLLRDRIEEYGGQVILISHHPEFINRLGAWTDDNFST